MATHFDEEKQKERLKEMHVREEEELARILSTKYGVEYVDLTRKSIDTDALRLIPEANARKAEVAAFRKVAKKLFVAVRAPERDDTTQEVQNLERLGYEVRRFMVSKASLNHAWDRYHDISYATETEAGVLTLSNEAIEKMLTVIKTVKDVGDQVQASAASKDTHRVSRVLEIIMGSALALGASDVHIEPEQEVVRMRLRIDGVLAEILTFDHQTYRLVLSRIKLLSGLKLNLLDIAQDGRFSIVVKEKEVEIRTSILPGNYGESIVMRILDPSTIALPLEALGFDTYLIEIFRREIKRPNGMILNTGPTGSGKTTTLYAFLRAVYDPGIKIVTIEDPIEYHLSGIVQTQVDKQYTFAQGLRSILRQDPDIIMVGEIRDSEVASTAVHSALTGHLVFSTLHTNNAAGTFPRLVDMGINSEILGSSLTVSMAQRLVRRLCKECKKEARIEGDDKVVVDRWLEHIPHPESVPEDRGGMWVAVGCEKCHNTGYKGRIAVVEVILMDEIIEKVVRTNPSERDIMRAARYQQIRIMQEDGIIKVLQGVTSLEELKSLVDLTEHAMVT